MQIKNIIVHHSGGTDANPLQDSSNYSLIQCNADHKIRFKMLSSLGFYVGYHYFIDKAGLVTQTRKDSEEGAHTIGWNNNSGNSADKASIGICLAGNFDATLPTPAQVASLKTLLDRKVKEYAIDPKNIVPHRAYATKTCYGNKLPANWAKSLVSAPPVKPTLSIVSIGSSGPAVTLVQNALANAGCQIGNFNSDLFGEVMAQSVLYFQIRNSVADIKELSILRGERVGPKTITALQKFL